MMENPSIRFDGQPLDKGDFPFFKELEDRFNQGEETYKTLILEGNKGVRIKTAVNVPSVNLAYDLDITGSEEYIQGLDYLITNHESRISRGRNFSNKREQIEARNDEVNDLRANLAGFGKAAFDADDYKNALLAFDAARILDDSYVQSMIKQYGADGGKEIQDRIVSAYVNVREYREKRPQNVDTINDMIKYFRGLNSATKKSTQ